MQKNKQMQKNKRQNVKNVRSVIRQTVTGYAGLSLGILLADRKSTRLNSSHRL